MNAKHRRGLDEERGEERAFVLLEPLRRKEREQIGNNFRNTACGAFYKQIM